MKINYRNGAAALFMAAILGGGSVLTWKNLIVRTDAAPLTTDTVETVAQESVPFYHGMINVNTLFQMVLGKHVIEDSAEGDKVVKLENGYLTFICDPADVTESAQSLIDLKNTCEENGTQLYFVLTPQKISKYDPQLPIGVQDNYNPMADDFLAQIDGKITYTDLRATIHDNGINQYDFFFKTDHHWTPEGAFWCWGQVAQTLKTDYGFEFDDKITDLSNYTVTTNPKSFLGSQGKRVGTVYAGVDDFSIIRPDYDTDFSLTVPTREIDREGDYAHALLVPEMFEKKDLYTDNPYAGYIGGDYGLCHIVNHQPPNHKRVLLVRDSFACVFTPYLAQACEQLDTIDKRDFPQTIASYIEETKPDLVLFLYNAAEMPAAANFQ